MNGLIPDISTRLGWSKGPCTYDVRTEGGGGFQELPSFADEQY